MPSFIIHSFLVLSSSSHLATTTLLQKYHHTVPIPDIHSDLSAGCYSLSGPPSRPTRGCYSLSRPTRGCYSRCGTTEYIHVWPLQLLMHSSVLTAADHSAVDPASRSAVLTGPAGSNGRSSMHIGPTLTTSRAGQGMGSRLTNIQAH